jgi:ComF family protein
MYAFKLGKRRYIADYFANRMAINVKYVYHDIKFDGICYVPISPKALRARGFNQSRDIAQKMSCLLEIPLIENALGAKNKKHGQHSVKGNKRETNVKGAFYPKRKIKGKILLIDDIKTTGATLNECAMQLLLAGADSVYCATGLISNKKKKG